MGHLPLIPLPGGGLPPPLGSAAIYQCVCMCSILEVFMDEREPIDRDDSMWRDNWQSLGVLLAVTVSVADTAIRTSTTLATIVIGTAALVVLWWYLSRDRRRD